jgi:hypothetical protein
LWLLCRFARLARRHGAQMAWGPQHVLPPLGGMPAVITVHDLVHKRYPQTMAPYNRLINAPKSGYLFLNRINANAIGVFQCDGERQKRESPTGANIQKTFDG